MKLLYYDDVTPEDYEPPFFKGCAENEAVNIWNRNPLKMEVGNVNSKHLVLALKVKSVLDPCDANDANSDDDKTSLGHESDQDDDFTDTKACNLLEIAEIQNIGGLFHEKGSPSYTSSCASKTSSTPVKSKQSARRATLGGTANEKNLNDSSGDDEDPNGGRSAANSSPPDATKLLEVIITNVDQLGQLDPSVVMLVLTDSGTIGDRIFLVEEARRRGFHFVNNKFLQQVSQAMLQDQNNQPEGLAAGHEPEGIDPDHQAENLPGAALGAHAQFVVTTIEELEWLEPEEVELVLSESGTIDEKISLVREARQRGFRFENNVYYRQVSLRCFMELSQRLHDGEFDTDSDADYNADSDEDYNAEEDGWVVIQDADADDRLLESEKAPGSDNNVEQNVQLQDQNNQPEGLAAGHEPEGIDPDHQAENLPGAALGAHAQFVVTTIEELEWLEPEEVELVLCESGTIDEKISLVREARQRGFRFENNVYYRQVSLRCFMELSQRSHDGEFDTDSDDDYQDADAGNQLAQVVDDEDEVGANLPEGIDPVVIDHPPEAQFAAGHGQVQENLSDSSSVDEDYEPEEEEGLPDKDEWLKWVDFCDEGWMCFTSESESGKQDPDSDYSVSS